MEPSEDNKKKNAYFFWKRGNEIYTEPDHARRTLK